MKKRIYWRLLKATFTSWNDDKGARLAAALAYYTVFSIAPFLVICIAIAGFVLGKDAAQHQILQNIGGIIGAKSADQIQTMMNNISKPSTNIIATIVGSIILLFGVVGLFGQLQDGLNTIWGVKARPNRKLIDIFKERFLTFIMIFGVAFLFLVSLIMSTLITSWSDYMNLLIPGLTRLWLMADFLVSFVITTILFALIFKTLPDVLLKWSNIWRGAIVTALLFTLGKFLLEIFLQRNDIGSLYGAAGSLIVILIWVYYSSQILFLGAEFTKIYSLHKGFKIVPGQHFMLISK